MIGDAKARGKVKPTTKAGPEMKARGMKRKGTAPRLNLPSMADSGGDNEQHAAAKRSTKGMRPGTGLPNGAGPEPYRSRNGAGQSFKTVGAKNNQGDAGAAIDAWCKGKRSSYK